jgi:hypothetical protein
MGVALYVVLDNEDPGFDTAVDGKAMGRSCDEVNSLCASIGIPPVDDFVSMSMDEVADILGEEIPEVQEKWFVADDGLIYFERLVTHLKSNPTAITTTDSVVEDIMGYIGVLQRAKSIGARWRLSMDI